MFKNEKGITLIALVVTIIILLILAGVSITTLSGDGLFGRAESSAAKYEQASQAENSTLSALMDKYDNYDTGSILVSWDAPIASMGSYINKLNPDTPRNSNFYDKQVMVVKPDGTKELLNPYQAQSTRVPEGTKIRFYYYLDKNSDHTYVGVYNGTSRRGVSTQLTEAKPVATLASIGEVRLALAEAPPMIVYNSNAESSLKDGSIRYIEMTVGDCDQIRFNYIGDQIRNYDDSETAYMWEIGCSIMRNTNANKKIELSWNSPIATRGSFINKLSPDSPRTTNLYDKQVVAVKPDGSKVLLNPYIAQSITVPVGTVLKFYYYTDTDSNTATYVGIGSAQNTPTEGYAQDGKIYSVDFYLDGEDIPNQIRIELEQDRLNEENNGGETEKWNCWIVSFSAGYIGDELE